MAGIKLKFIFDFSFSQNVISAQADRSIFMMYIFPVALILRPKIETYTDLLHLKRGLFLWKKDMTKLPEKTALMALEPDITGGQTIVGASHNTDMPFAFIEQRNQSIYGSYVDDIECGMGKSYDGKNWILLG